LPLGRLATRFAVRITAISVLNLFGSCYFDCTHYLQSPLLLNIPQTVLVASLRWPAEHLNSTRLDS
jgi:hypothetical protein